MKYRKLGDTGIEVSLFGLGTMTWGDQNTEADAHAQIGVALSKGVTLLDAAEMYPVPPRPETQGRTETYIGNWLQKNGRRKDIVLATKIAGPAHLPRQPRHIRNGETRFDAATINAAIDASLKRLKTDYVDLYQLHWPARPTNTFGRRDYPWDNQPEETGIAEAVDALDSLVKSGKARAVGVSNETPWGVAEFLRRADTRGSTRIASIQNPYNLLNRTFETGLSEFAHRERVGLLAYSPFAFGVLSGKYLDGAKPPGARLTLNNRFARYDSPAAEAAIRDYVTLAKEHGLTPAQLALGFVASRPFVTSYLSGASRLDQLEDNLTSAEITLSAEVIAAIEAIHARIPNPTP